MKEVIEVPHLSDALRRLNTPTSLLIRCDKMLYSCGVPPMDALTGEIIKGGMKEQTHAVMNVIKIALESAGSNLNNIIKATIYITDPNLMGEVNEVYRDYFPGVPPVRSFVAVKPWPLPFDIEIDVVAYV